ncbi:MAG: DUF6798 domain-containing protein [Bacteroidota bacterium]
MAPSPQSLVSFSRLVWLGLGVTLLAYLVRFGYGYGYSDQDDVLPFVMALGDPALFASDWFVQEQLGTLNVRTYVAYGLWALAHVMSLEWAVGVAYLASFGLLFSGLYRVYMSATGHQVASVAAVFVALVLTPQWTLGGNDLAHSMFVPSMLAWGIVLHGVHAAQRRRWGTAGAIVGAAVIAQALVGLQVALVIGIALLLHSVFAKRWRPTLAFGAGVLVASSPMLIPLILQVVTAAPLPESAPSIRTVLAEYRAPHHYLVNAFPMRAWVRFGVLLATGIGAALWLTYKALVHQHLRPALAVLAIIGVTLACATVLTVVWPSTFVLKLQLFKLTVLAKVILIGLIAMGLATVLPALDAHVLTSRRTLVATGVAGLLICGGVLATRPDATPWHPRMGSTVAMHELMTWAHAESSADAHFLVPPTWSGFRTQARRSTVVTIKGFPFTDAAMVAWYHRMRAVVPEGSEGSAYHLPITARTDAGYAALSSTALETAADTYAATHIVTPIDTLSTVWVHAATFGDWHVHERRGLQP